MTPPLQAQAKALGDATRHAIFRYVADAPGPVDVAELTAHFGLNHNAIRQHLAKLVAADLVIEGRSPSTGRGRPRLNYSVHPAADGRWGVTSAYERLALLLGEMVRTGDGPEEVGRRAGRAAVGSDAGDGDPVAILAGSMAQQGFEPEVHTRGRRADVVLLACPFATTALAEPEIVCALHLGMAQGIAEATGGIVVEELVANDPRQAACRIRMRVERTDS